MSFAQLTVSSGQTANTLVGNLLGPGVTFSNATLTSVGTASGLFSTGVNPTNIGIVQGVMLTSGSVGNAPGPNNSGSTTTNNNAPGDADLNAIVSGTLDASTLQFDFIPQSAQISFNYVFASEEYPEFYCSSFNDVFAFLLSGPTPGGGNYVKENLAIVPGTSDFVTINNVGPGTCGGLNNSSQYVSNVGGTTIEYDGFTNVFAATANVVAGQTYTIKLAIADVSDRSWDSGVLLETGSFSSSSLSITPLNASILQGTEHCVTATVLDAANAPVENEAVTFQVSGNNTVAPMVVNTDVNGEALFCYTATNAGNDVVNASAGCTGCNPVNANVIVNACNIIAVTAGTQSACSNNLYDQDVIVAFTEAPLTGTLDVHGESFAIGTSPQTVTLTGLVANGNPLNVLASFSDDPACIGNLTFTAPAACSSPPPASDLFITKWVVAAGETITIPTTGMGYNYDVDWDNDGTIDDFGFTGDATSPWLLRAGEHTVAISGDFPRIYFNDSGDKDKITEIVQWGTNPWTSMRYAFAGCSNLNITNPAAGVPDLSSVTSMSHMFSKASSFNGPIGDWDVSNVTDMFFAFCNLSM